VLLENLTWKLKGLGHHICEDSMVVNASSIYENTIEIMENELNNPFVN
jgi:hypothetical protein